MPTPLDSTIQELDAIEARAYRNWFALAPPDVARELGLEVRDIGGATALIAPGLPTPEFNRIVGFGNVDPLSESDLDNVIDLYRSAGVTHWWAHVSPGRHAGQVRAVLHTRGLSPPDRKAWIKFQRNSDSVPNVPTPCSIHIANRADAVPLGEAICAAFGVPDFLVPWFAATIGAPNWYGVVAKLDGIAIGGGLVNIQGTSAWLGAGGVRTEARRQHAHRAIMAARIRVAVDARCSLIATETGEPIADEPNPSLRNMYACGFIPAFSRENYQYHTS